MHWWLIWVGRVCTVPYQTWTTPSLVGAALDRQNQGQSSARSQSPHRARVHQDLDNLEVNCCWILQIRDNRSPFPI